ncbi:MAG: glycosyl hydrolase family 32, partial [Arthrobacter sp.]|nr:glycosyl hydrolase family 32 [Arthrobacter sp.]
VGSGIRQRGGTAFLYESADLRRWDYIGPLFIGDASQGDPADTDWTGTMWECVDLFRAGHGSLGSAPSNASPDVLVFSAWNDGDTHHPLYWTGRYAGDSFEPVALHRLDYGGRFFYAPQSFEDESGRRVMFGWMQEGRSDAAMVEAGWSGVMSLPRTVTASEDGTLRFAPVPEIKKLRREHLGLSGLVLGGALVPQETGVSGQQLDLELDLELAPGALLRLGVLGSSGGSTSDGPAEETVIELRRADDGGNNGTLRLDRTQSSLDPTVDVDYKSGPVPMPEGRVHLRVILDRSAVEIFANGIALTARIYPTLGGENVSLAAEGTAKVLSLDAWTMADIFDSTRSLFP